MRLVIDADPLVYLCGFGAEDHVYELIAEDPDGKLHQSIWADGNKMKEWKTANINKGEWTFIDQIKRVTPLGEELALKIVDGKMHTIINRVRELTRRDIDETYIFLSGPDNFREELATIAVYKGNRDEAQKPYYYQLIRDHLTEKWGAEVVHGCEADDACSITVHHSLVACVVASSDKDLDQIQGQHYDYQKDVMYYVDALDAKLFFYEQILSGDATDNIPGLSGVGPGKAKGMIDAWVAAYYDDSRKEPLEQYLWGWIVEKYEQVGVKDYNGPLTPEQQALEMARLVRIQQYDGELWAPPQPGGDG